MKHRAGSVLRLAVPLRALTQRFAFLFLVVAAFGLMLVGKAETVLVERMRAAVVDFVAPILSGLSRPAATVAEAVENVRRLAELHSENERLRAQNARLLRWQEVARALAAENTALRDLLKFVPAPRARFNTARVIGDSVGVFARSILVNAGARDGLVKGQAAVTGDGLVGRVVSVGRGSARVLLVTDLNSRIPVLLEGTRERAILTGDNTDKPRLIFVARSVPIAIGERIVTSGHGDIFPPGLPIGLVSSIEDRVIKVQTFVRLDTLEYVRIVDFRAVTIPSVMAPPGTTKTGAPQDEASMTEPLL